ncbi:TrkH family potassium uptake protein [Halorussus gelatinilyticus]|uniref:TrkH family potassium uptake protein n=1 Tax=Halorussus gelatinilyticus TaxID=2937524 RepID=A0A8U0ILD1_9EURY|nr:potassium transporter TrkG [Halorussus gelatinilyticus]UPW01486.1 TrkH family potassium uptake protein [Halorussus gelatinilyticus]
MGWDRRATCWNVGRALEYFSCITASLVTVSLAAGEYYAVPGVLGSALATFLAGVGFKRAGAPSETSDKALSYASAAAVWLVVGAFGALPFLSLAWTVALRPTLASAPPLSPTLAAFRSPTNALFEAVSGLTGTGLTVTRRESRLPATLQFWRSLLQWVGGVGIVVLVVSVFDSTGPLADYYENEIPVGEMELQPADPRAMLLAFSVVTLASIAVLWAVGMSAWAALNHGLSAISTGGFTITDASAAAYGVPVQVALMPIMMVGALPVPVYYLALRGDLREFYVDLQSRWLWVSLAVGSVAVTGLLAFDATYPSAQSAVLYGTFQFVSAMTCAGFGTASVGSWPTSALVVVTLGMFVGGAMGSTTAGIKVIRGLSLVEGTWHRVTNVFFPGGDTGYRDAAASESSYIGSIVTRHATTNYDDASFVTVLWFGTFVFGVLALAILMPDSVPFVRIVFDVASAVSAVGLSTGITDAGMPGSAKLTLVVVMWAGRLEVFPVLVLLRSLLVADDDTFDANGDPDD